MQQHPFGALRSSRPTRRRTAVAIAAASTLALVSLGTAGPAVSAVDPACPAAFPVADLLDGQLVDGLTVSKGTTPEGFSGEILGVLEDGIAPDLDMVIARLSSPEIDRVGGIWQGMSGSPVYAEDGRLIGAVSYGLSWGSSPVAGITPAEDMHRLLREAPTAATTEASLAQQEDDVTLPGTMQRRMVASGDTTRAQAEGGMSRLPLPLGISGTVTGKRLSQAAKALELDNVRVFKAGAVSASAAPTEIVPGGNMAGSLSYGDLSAVGVGTATAVCGDEIIGFGHPFTFSGPSTLTLHGAKAIYVQEESLGAPFKVANATAPLGSISEDRMAGILGTAGATPSTTDVTSYVSVPDRGSRTGTTKISVPDYVPDLAAFHLLIDQDRVFDGISGGRAAVGWTVTGERADGSLFSYSRNNRFANKGDISFEPIWDLYEQLWRLQSNDVEDVKITGVNTKSVMNRDFQRYTLGKAEVRSAGVWRKLATDKVLTVKAGTTKRFRLTLKSPQLPTRTVRLAIPVPKRAAGKEGYLRLFGGNSSYYYDDDYYYYEDGPSSSDTSLDQMLREMANAPRNDHALGELRFWGRRGELKRSDRALTKAVVDGSISVEVRAMRR
jgi:hypothetical protein